MFFVFQSILLIFLIYYVNFFLNPQIKFQGKK
jgi:hypothetical protein